MGVVVVGPCWVVVVGLVMSGVVVVKMGVVVVGPCWVVVVCLVIVWDGSYQNGVF